MEVKDLQHRRREHRLRPNQTALLNVLTLRSGPAIQVALIESCASGMRLRSKLPVPCGVPIEIESGHLRAHGSVIRCEQEADAYELGVLVSATDWIS